MLTAHQSSGGLAPWELMRRPSNARRPRPQARAAVARAQVSTWVRIEVGTAPRSSNQRSKQSTHIVVSFRLFCPIDDVGNDYCHCLQLTGCYSSVLEGFYDMNVCIRIYVDEGMAVHHPVFACSQASSNLAKALLCQPQRGVCLWRPSGRTLWRRPGRSSTYCPLAGMFKHSGFRGNIFFR